MKRKRILLILAKGIDLSVNAPCFFVIPTYNIIVRTRVKYRESQGGHGIPESDIEKRYVETFMQLNTVLKECNLIAFYDNTESFRRFAICKNGELVRISSNVPTWFLKVEILK